MYLVSVALLSVSSLLQGVSGYGSGVPESACKTMTPGPPHFPNQVTENEARNVPFIINAVAQNNGQVKGSRDQQFHIYFVSFISDIEDE